MSSVENLQEKRSRRSRCQLIGSNKNRRVEDCSHRADR